MSTRSGTFLPIQELVRDIGEDATKFFYLTKKKDQHLEFDIDEAREKTKITLFTIFNMHMPG